MRRDGAHPRPPALTFSRPVLPDDRTSPSAAPGYGTRVGSDICSTSSRGTVDDSEVCSTSGRPNPLPGCGGPTSPFGPTSSSLRSLTDRLNYQVVYRKASFTKNFLQY